MLNTSIVSIERQIFERFLEEVKVLMEQKHIVPPSGFISYAWESPPYGAPNKTLQAWLSQLKKDFAALNIDLFLDIQNINGDMRAAMREIKSRDFVFLIGTPRFKERAEQDSLYRLPTFNPQLLSMTGNAVVMVENSDKIYVVEKNHQQLLLIGETTLPQANSAQIEWKQEAGYQRAQSSEVVHQLIEQALKQVSSKAITNVAYEFGLTLDKVKQSPQALMPLLYQGDFGASFPQYISSSILIRDFREPNEYYRNLISTSPLGLLPAICAQLQTDSDYAKLVNEFLEWKFDVWKEQLSHRFREELQLYIPARGDYTADCRNPKPMEEHMSEFMQNHATKVILLLGGSGSGKTSFGQYLSTLKAQQHYTPIWISLPALQNPKENAIPEGLKLLGVPESHIPSFKQKPLLIILDGYDEVKDLANLYESNHLEQWNAKVIISCRNEFLTAKYYNLWFKPKNSQYIERHIAPFNAAEISAYLQKYIALQHPSWSLARYEAEIAQIEGLRQMIETPFLLHIVADVLPDIVSKYQRENEQIKLTKCAFYECFIDQWFEKHLVRWKEQGKLNLLDEGLNLDNNNQQAWNDERIKVLRGYAENFAYRLFSAGIETISPKADYPWIKELFDNKPRAKLIRSSCPLKKTGEDSHTFIHKSLLEYLVMPKMVQEVRMFGKKKETAASLSDIQELSRLNQKLLPPAVIGFLVDTMKENSELQSRLWSIILSTKKNDVNKIAAANAMTILNKAKVSFSGKGLSGIQIQGANLSGAVLDDTNLEKADLTDVNFSGAWLHGTNFMHANMTGTKFGEYPSLSFRNPIYSICYSPNGRWLAIGGSLYDAATRVLTYEFKSGKIVFSPDSRFLTINASVSNSQIVELWWVDTRVLYKSIKCKDNFSTISSISFSLDAHLLAIGRHQIELYWVDSGLLYKTLTYPEAQDSYSKYLASLTPVNFSPDGLFLVTGSAKGVVLWQMEVWTVYKTLENSENIRSIDFSRDGRFLATGSNKAVKLWQVDSWILQKTLHTEHFDSLSFSFDGRFLATGSLQQTTIKLWHVETGNLYRTLEGHTKAITSLSFSPDNEVLVTSSLDGSIRFWSIEIEIEVSSKTLENRTTDIKRVDFNPDGKLLAIECMDNTTKFWQINPLNHATKFWQIGTRTIYNTLENHIFSGSIISPDGRFSAAIEYGKVKISWARTGTLHQTLVVNTNSISFSPDTRFLATGGGYSAELWYVETGLLYKTLENFLAGHSGSITSVNFSPDNRLLATGSHDKTVKLWWIETGILQRVIHKTLEHNEVVTSVRFSPDGKWLGTISNDNVLRLWDPFDGQKAAVFSIAVTSAPNSIAFHENSQEIFLASGHKGCLQYWQLIQKNNKPYLQLLWSTHQNTLLSQYARIEGVKGLSKNNVDLLLQRGAIGKPFVLNDAGKNVSTSNNHSSSSSQSNNNAQHKSEALSTTQEPRESSNHGGQQDNKIDCKIL